MSCAAAHPIVPYEFFNLAHRRPSGADQPSLWLWLSSFGMVLLVALLGQCFYVFAFPDWHVLELG